jgi:CheY-like chemotaxis protein
VKIISAEIVKTEEMEKYERETGKYAVWRGKVTDGFLRWQKGEKIYDKDKERISFYVSDNLKDKWREFAEDQNYSTISKFIRDAVNNFIDKKAILFDKGSENLNIDALSRISHGLKEPLTSIKGYLQLLLESNKDKLNDDVISIIDKVLNQTNVLETKIVESLENIHSKSNQYDILIIEDSLPTVNLLRDYFESKGYTCKCALSGNKGLDALKSFKPKLILLDIMLPDINGFDLCINIKTNEETKDIPVYYLTAIPALKVEERMKDTKADGKILKPFNLSDLNFLFERLK